MTGKVNLTPRRGVPVVRPGDTAPKREHVLTIDGAEAPVMAVNIPARVRGVARLRVARQQIADRLGVPPASLSIMPTTNDRDWSRLVVIDRARLSELSEGAGRKRRAILPDYLALPEVPGEFVVFGRDGVVMVREGASNGFSAPDGVAPLMLRRAFASSEISKVAYGGELSEEVLAVIRGAGLDARAVTIDPSRTSRPNIDLLTALDAETQSSGLGVWLLAAAIGVLAFALWAAGVMVETRAIERELAAVRADTEAVLRDGLVPSGPLLDVRTQVERAMSTGRESETSEDVAGLALLSRVSVLAFERGVAVESIELDADSLRLSITAQNFDTVEALAADFEAGGIRADNEMLRARDGGGVEARFRLEEGA